MDLGDLRIFRAVVHEGGVTRAAARLNRVQSNVTTRVRQLEQDLGVELFIREGKRLHLSPTGKLLLDYADRLLDLAQEARDAMHDGEPRGLLRLGAMESTAAVRLPEPLSTFHRRYPQVRLELQTRQIQQLSAAVVAGELDAALVAEPIADARFEKIAAFVEETVIVACAQHPRITANTAAPKTMIVFEHGCPHRKRLEAWYEKRGEIPERIIELGSYHAMLGCVVAGMGAALLPRSVLATFPESKRLSVHPLPRGEDRIVTLMIWRRGADCPNTRALAEILSARRASGKRRR